ncbi:MAG: hypothetical protein RLT05_28555 [Bauldia litoralis]
MAAILPVRLRGLIVLLSACWVWVAPAHADSLPGPTVDFTGTMVIRYPPAQPLTIRIDYTSQRVRRELAAFGTRFVTIVDRTKDRTVMLFPDLKRYSIRPLDPDAHDTVKSLARGAALERVGPETLGGVDTVKFRLQGRSPRGRTFAGFLWLTPHNIMIRMEGQSTVGGKARQLVIEMKDLRSGAVYPAVFDIPAGYEKVKPK